MSKRYYSQLVDKEYSCPNCKSSKIQLDTPKGEIYCQECGLVISDPTGEGVLPYDYGEVRNVIPDSQKEITNYRHTYTNRQLMKHR